MNWSHHSLLLLALSFTACAEEEETSSTNLASTDEADGTLFSGPISMETEDGETLCTGSLQVSLTAGVLSGVGTCGDLELTLSGWLDDDGVVSRGSVQAHSASVPTPPPDDASLSGLRSGDTLELIWSLEMPLPDDPPVDDDYLTYTERAYGQARLQRQ